MRHLISRCSLVIALALSGSVSIGAQAQAPADSSARTAALDPATLERKVDELLAAHQKINDFSGTVLIARQGKPDVTFTEFTHVHDICHGPEKLLETLVYSEIEPPMVAQLYGNDPELFYQAAHAVCELGFDGLDINMGCPSKNVAASGSGAGLITTGCGQRDHAGRQTWN